MDRLTRCSVVALAAAVYMAMAGFPVYGGPAAISSFDEVLKVPAGYVFERRVEFVRRLSFRDFDAEVYWQANGPGTRQRVVMTIPRGCPAGRTCPAVVTPFYYAEALIGHELDSGSTDAQFGAVPLMAELTRRGYICINADCYHLTYRPSSKRRDDFTRWADAGEALMKDWPQWSGMGKLLADTELLVDMLMQDRRVDTNRIGIAGHSLGAKMALYAGMRDPRIKAVLASDPSLCWERSNWNDTWYFGEKLAAMKAGGLTHGRLVSDGGGKPLCILAGDVDGAWSLGMVKGVRNLVFIDPRLDQHTPVKPVLQAGLAFLDKWLKGKASMRQQDEERLRVLTGLSLSDIVQPVQCMPAVEKRMMSGADYVPERADGRTERTMTWALRKFKEANPSGMHPYLKDRETFLGWRKKFRARLVKQFTKGMPENPEFALLKRERREGYELRTYEWYPFERLAVRLLMLVPDNVRPGRTPAVICKPGGGGSVEGLAGEKNPYFTMFPLRNRQAWWYAKMGMIAVAVENTCNAHSCYDDMTCYNHIRECNKLFPLVGMDVNTLSTWTVLASVKLLKREGLVDPARIAVSGLSRGASIINAALVSDEITACNFNDFLCDHAARKISTTDIPAGETSGGGSYVEKAIAFAPKPLLLNEGGPWKNVIEDVRRAYELTGHPENLTVHYYDRYADPKARKYDGVDLRDVTGLTYERFHEAANCDPHDHSFHPESALPWIGKLFLGSRELPGSLMPAVEQAHAEREHTPEQLYPPDGLTGRKAWGWSHVTTEADFLPDRPDGRTEKILTWLRMEQRRILVEKSRAVADRFKLLETRRRDGYKVEIFEFYPDDFLAVKAFVLTPDNAKRWRTPVEICVGSGGASIEHLAGEPDPFKTRGGRHDALEAMKKGRIAVALASPGEANCSMDGVGSEDSRRRVQGLLAGTEWSIGRLIELESRMCRDFFEGR